MTWILLLISYLIVCVNVVHSERSNILSIIAKQINEWNKIDTGTHDIVLFRLSKDEAMCTSDELLNDIVKAIPEYNVKLLPSMHQEKQKINYKKASFVIIVSDVHSSVCIMQ